ncbi:glutathione S-transferase domain-containing protein [Decorospora gaudefroyi]|uniref:Glutathione S-transferase domain-containing protein n=1 Tax=Decorospora gaudefroyi TaxID=184978 RepID=A0A6A5JXH7_9PLEO|nr:glutathione S-transferase domain-containing protein [Decorospora gaudefroyi]
MASPPPLTLISATPSPFARMNRIVLKLKNIPFTLQNEIPWEKTTATPLYNPLEKLPILLFPDDRAPVYDSAHINEYLVAKYADWGPKLLTGDTDLDLRIRQIVVLSEGCLDAIVIANFECARAEGMQSGLWLERQNRKIDGAMRAFSDMVTKRRGEGKAFLVGEALSLADIAVVCCLGILEFAGVRVGWREKYGVLGEWWAGLEDLDVFRETRPVAFALREQVV